MKRPFHCLACAGAFAHHAFELAAGTGLVFQPYLGLTGSLALWSLVFPTTFALAARGSARWDRALAFFAGGSVAAPSLHFTLWPWELRRGVPVLTEAEGLQRDLLPAYNAILYSWSIPAVVAIAREVPKGTRRWALFGFLAVLPFRTSAAHHFRWVRDQAKNNPAWWNRALQDGGATRR